MLASPTFHHLQVACEYFNDLVKRNECSYTQYVETEPMPIRLFVKTVEPETALEPAKMTHEDVAELLIDQVLLIWITFVLICFSDKKKSVWDTSGYFNICVCTYHILGICASAEEDSRRYRH